LLFNFSKVNNEAEADDYIGEIMNLKEGNKSYGQVALLIEDFLTGDE
jgi:hypothetical protein